VRKRERPLRRHRLSPLSPPPHPLPRISLSSSPFLAPPQVQWEIERDEIEWENSQKLGAGAFGEVIRAKWRGTPVAVKKGEPKGWGENKQE
jgi:hypothetical protein